MVLPALLALLAATVLGAPVFVALGGSGPDPVLGRGDADLRSMPVDHYRLVVNPSFPTIPLFTLAGYFLAEGGASKRLVRVFQALFGHCAAARPSSRRWSALFSLRSRALLA